MPSSTREFPMEGVAITQMSPQYAITSSMFCHCQTLPSLLSLIYFFSNIVLSCCPSVEWGFYLYNKFWCAMRPSSFLWYSSHMSSPASCKNSLAEERSRTLWIPSPHPHSQQKIIKLHFLLGIKSCFLSIQNLFNSRKSGWSYNMEPTRVSLSLSLWRGTTVSPTEILFYETSIIHLLIYLFFAKSLLIWQW